MCGGVYCVFAGVKDGGGGQANSGVVMTWFACVKAVKVC